MPAIRLRSASQSAAESAALPRPQSLTIGGNATCFQPCVPGAAPSRNVAAKRKLASGLPTCRKHTASGLRSRQVSDRHRGYGERSSKPVAGVVEGPTDEWTNTGEQHTWETAHRSAQCRRPCRTCSIRKSQWHLLRSRGSVWDGPIFQTNIARVGTECKYTGRNAGGYVFR